MRYLEATMFLMLLGIFLVSCASTYSPPSATSPALEESVSGMRSELFESALRVLTNEGFGIEYRNEGTGEIITSGKTIKFDKTIADCGSNMGLPAQFVNNMDIKVTVTLHIDDNSVAASAGITGEDIRGNENYEADVSCVSTGGMEKRIIQKIKARSMMGI
jgi:hypothetical protein